MASAATTLCSAACPARQRDETPARRAQLQGYRGIYHLEDNQPIIDERFLAAQVRGKGIVMFTACSHAGVINDQKACAVGFSGDPALRGRRRFHLARGNEKIIADSVVGRKDIYDLKPEHPNTDFRC
jgi:hypothetical protein